MRTPALALSLVLAMAATPHHGRTSAHAQPSTPSARAEATLAAFAKLRDPGVVGLLRHARAPGVGDPAGFNLSDCSTQRPLSDEGRRQARALGHILRRTGVREARVLSSAWCRCLETARLLALGPVETAPFLNSFYAGRGSESAATMGLRRAVLAKADILQPTVMVTHQVNITALTGLVPTEGEVIFVRGTAAGGVETLGRASLD